MQCTADSSNPGELWVIMQYVGSETLVNSCSNVGNGSSECVWFHSGAATVQTAKLMLASSITGEMLSYRVGRVVSMIQSTHAFSESSIQLLSLPGEMVFKCIFLIEPITNPAGFNFMPAQNIK